MLIRRRALVTFCVGALVALALVGCNSASDSTPSSNPQRSHLPTQLPVRIPTTTTFHRSQSGAFKFSVAPLSARVRRRIIGSSWHQGCPVALRDLRFLKISFWGFDRRRHRGEMIVVKTAVPAIRRVFAVLYRDRFPIHRMRLVDQYGGDDYASVDADNTSAFNCRRATNAARWSEHAYGRAVDVNPIENPYVYPDHTTVHVASESYIDRTRHRRGMATRRGILVRAFDNVGWQWGGRWSFPRDYQHFSATGR